jgi:hypothetical protein
MRGAIEAVLNPTAVLVPLGFPCLSRTTEPAYNLNLDGIVSKRKDSRYSSGRSPHCIKAKTRTRLRLSGKQKRIVRA